MAKFNQSLIQAGVLLALDGLHPASKGARVTLAGGKHDVTDGPFTEAKEVVGGYWIIEVKDQDEAVEWASRAPLSEGDVRRGPPDLRDDRLPAAGRPGRRANEHSAPVSRGDAARDRGGLADRVRAADRRARADACATSALAEDLAQDALVAALETVAASRASRTTRAPG